MSVDLHHTGAMVERNVLSRHLKSVQGRLRRKVFLQCQEVEAGARIKQRPGGLTSLQRAREWRPSQSLRRLCWWVLPADSSSRVHHRRWGRGPRRPGVPTSLGMGSGLTAGDGEKTPPRSSAAGPPPDLLARGLPTAGARRRERWPDPWGCEALGGEGRGRQPAVVGTGDGG